MRALLFPSQALKNVSRKLDEIRARSASQVPALLVAVLKGVDEETAPLLGLPRDGAFEVQVIGVAGEESTRER